MTASYEENVQRLVDIEDIKVLKLKYARFCDDGYDPDGIASCFTQDGIWDGGPLGHAEGQEGIKAFFAATPKIVAFAVHYTTNPIIEITGDTANGTWYLWQPMVLVHNKQAMLLAAHYHEQYQRTDSGWLIERLRLDVKRFSPYEEGFGKVEIADLPT